VAKSAEPEDLKPVWRALASALRRKILDLLRDGPKTTGELAAEFPSHSRFAVMQHLLVLGQAGLVLHRRQGRQRFNYLNPIPIQEMYDRWVSRYQQPWAEALVSLRDELEAGGVPRAQKQKRRRTRAS
jgi:DNA-binding transcriptional ArsR family regulator